MEIPKGNNSYSCKDARCMLTLISIYKGLLPEVSDHASNRHLEPVFQGRNSPQRQSKYNQGTWVPLSFLHKSLQGGPSVCGCSFPSQAHHKSCEDSTLSTCPSFRNTISDTEPQHCNLKSIIIGSILKKTCDRVTGGDTIQTIYNQSTIKPSWE